MFQLYHHHDPLRLAELLAALRARHAGEPLRPDTVLVPNRAVGRWLQMQLAESEGIAANLELPLPGRFVWRTLAESLPGGADSSDFERGALRWHLYALLPEIARREPRVARYLEGQPAGVHRL